MRWYPGLPATSTLRSWQTRPGSTSTRRRVGDGRRPEWLGSQHESLDPFVMDREPQPAYRRTSAGPWHRRAARTTHLLQFEWYTATVSIFLLCLPRARSSNATWTFMILTGQIGHADPIGVESGARNSWAVMHLHLHGSALLAPGLSLTPSPPTSNTLYRVLYWSS